MQSKEVKKWQDEEALKRYQMIAPLLDESIDEGKRLQLREEIAEKNGRDMRDEQAPRFVKKLDNT